MDDKKRDKQKEDVILNPEGQDEKTQQEILHGVLDDKRKGDGALLQQLEEIDQKYKRALADYQNLVRRTADEKREWAKFSNKELVLKLLPILDTLVLAEKHTKDHTFALTVQQFLQVLEQEGIKKIKTVGEVFNPRTMDAITTVDGEEGKVVEEIRIGFLMGDMVFRPAQVAVGKGKK